MYQWRGLGDSSSIQALITSLAPSYGIPPNLALAVAKQESGFQPNVVSSAGAQGVMQLMPGTAASLGVTDPFDPTQNIQGGLSYLQQMYAKFGNWTQALEAYNAGPNGNLAGSSGYANAIFAAHARLLQGGVYEAAWQLFEGNEAAREAISGDPVQDAKDRAYDLDAYISRISLHYATDPDYASKIITLAHGPHVTAAIAEARGQA